MRRLAALFLLVIAPGWGAPGHVIAASQSSVAAPPATGAVVFVGSSIFRRWTRLSEQMAPLPVVNRAIDGIQTMHVLAMIDRTVLPLQPKVVVYYCGSNDVDAGDSAEAIFGRIRQFVDRVSAALPATRIVFVSINRAPEKQDRWDVVDADNRQVEAYAAKTTRLQYVDVNPVLFNRDGSPRIDLYMPDELHLRPPAYEGFARILKPILTKAFETP
jgi:lysophospholipase L1-like esterase